MNREIKFNVICKGEKTIRRAWGVDFLNELALVDISGCFEWRAYKNLLEYVGQTDKDNKEIYEDDIIYFTIFDYEDNDTQYTGKIVLIGSTYCIEYKSRGEITSIDLDWVVAQDCELSIIGNNSTNPELLETEK